MYLRHETGIFPTEITIEPFYGLDVYKRQVKLGTKFRLRNIIEIIIGTERLA